MHSTDCMPGLIRQKFAGLCKNTYELWLLKVQMDQALQLMARGLLCVILYMQQGLPQGVVTNLFKHKGATHVSSIMRCFKGEEQQQVYKSNLTVQISSLPAL